MAQSLKPSLRAIKRICDSIVRATAAITLAFGVSLALPVVAQTYGTLDTSWGGVGYVKTSILSPTSLSSQDRGRAIAIQLDGKAVIAGVCYNATPPVSYSACVARYNANGALDTTFNTTGVATYPLVGVDSNYLATSIAVTPYGQILVVTGCTDANSRRQFCALRFTKNGALDTAFGSGGLLVTALTTNSNYVGAVAYQTDGRLILGGLCGTQICALRYFEDGTLLDTSFGNNGLLLNSVTGTFSRETFTMVVDASDRVLLGGSCFINSQTVFCLSRFTVSGQADTSFASGGIAAIPALPGGSDFAYAMTIQNDGKILLAGQAFNTIGSGSGSTVFDFATVRYETNGSLDTTFGAGAGFVVTRIADTYSEARTIVQQADGKILVGGYCQDFQPSGQRFCVVAYNADGTLDTSFNNGLGYSKLLLGPQSSFAVDQIYAMALGRDRKLYAAGQCRNTTNTGRIDFCVARYGGSPEGGLACVVDLSGDGIMRATHDSLALNRVTRGMWDDNYGAVLSAFNSVIFSPQQIWGPYKRWLRGSFDYDGDGAETSNDAVIHARVALGFTEGAVTTGLSFAPAANRTSWTALRSYFNTRCGLNLP